MSLASKSIWLRPLWQVKLLQMSRNMIYSCLYCNVRVNDHQNVKYRSHSMLSVHLRHFARISVPRTHSTIKKRTTPVCSSFEASVSLFSTVLSAVGGQRVYVLSLSSNGFPPISLYLWLWGLRALVRTTHYAVDKGVTIPSAVFTLFSSSILFQRPEYSSKDWWIFLW